MSAKLLLLMNLSIGFYNVGTIWAHEIDIFRSWKFVDARDFLKIQTVHWKKLPYWVFIPVGLALAGAVALIWDHPSNSPLWAIAGVLLCQGVSLALTGAFWGRWQASLSRDPLGPQSIYLKRILSTHWVRTILINLNAGILFAWVWVTIW